MLKTGMKRMRNLSLTSTANQKVIPITANLSVYTWQQREGSDVLVLVVKMEAGPQVAASFKRFSSYDKKMASTSKSISFSDFTANIALNAIHSVTLEPMMMKRDTLRSMRSAVYWDANLRLNQISLIEKKSKDQCIPKVDTKVLTVWAAY